VTVIIFQAAESVHLMDVPSQLG